MKCKVCGAESGKYPLCRACNMRKDRGEIIKCTQCGNWHYINLPCPLPVSTINDGQYLYEVRKTLISKSEQSFFHAIKASVPDGYYVFPQINLASFIDRTDESRFQNELFRNIDFLITDIEYKPIFIIEINDQTHLNRDRKERDEKVQKICEEAGIPILKLWTSYGVNPEYIKGRISETLNNLPIKRIRHFSQEPVPLQPITPPQPPLPQAPNKKSGCYVATCVYGSYDCPEVWVLRRYRDSKLAQNFFGRIFIRIYYFISPRLVKHFGKCHWFVSFWKSALDKFVAKLQNQGIDNSPYVDEDRKS